jgi:prepilin-type N-terminal cleavage/methylation domain-containing protein
MRNDKRKGFTLIELLIVVAIIAILALIAVPNFLEAQVRAKVSRVKSDHRTLYVALESYYVDNNSHPPFRSSIDNPVNLVPLSTPIAYMTSPHLTDPFKLYPPGTNQTTGRPYLGYIYIPFTKTWIVNNVLTVQPDWAAQVDEKFRRAPAFPRVLGHDLGYGPPASADRFPGPFTFVLTSYGPDSGLQFDDDSGGYNRGGINAYMPYDPTNGTVSSGDIYRFGGE